MNDFLRSILLIYIDSANVNVSLWHKDGADATGHRDNGAVGGVQWSGMLRPYEQVPGIRYQLVSWSDGPGPLLGQAGS